MRRILAAVLVMLVAACRGDGPTAPANQPTGTYALVQVNGTSLPTTFFQNSAGRAEFVSGTLVLRTDGSYTETRNTRLVFTLGGTENSTLVENGTYSITGSQVTFTIPASESQSAVSYTGALSNGTVTYTWNNIAYHYQR